MAKFLVFIAFFFTACAQKALVPATGEMSRLLREADSDGDQKITVLDKPKDFTLKCRCGKDLEVRGVYPLSNLLQELKLAEVEGRREVNPARIFENPVDRISRSIRERYWANLVRRVDLPHLAQVLEDSKLRQDRRYLYVPAADQKALEYFAPANADASLNVQVLPLPTDHAKLRGRHGLLALALRTREGRTEGVPFVVPGGRFNEMYGWDSYFESLGLIRDGRADLAQAMTDNFVYQIENYGKIMNANRSYYLNRSQPPFLTSLILAVDKTLPRSSASAAWRERAIKAAIAEYENVWQSPERLTPTGLNRYFSSGHGIPPEVEPGHFDFILRPAARRHGLTVAELQRRYDAGTLKDKALDDFFAHDRAVRESGHDTTYRWRVKNEDRAADFVTVDLNALLYKYEIDLALLTRDPRWSHRAAERKARMMKYLWDPEQNLFFDYDFKAGRRSTYLSATAFYPLWAKMLDPETAKKSLAALLAGLEAPGGLLASGRASFESVAVRAHARQWDYPNGWPPHQMIAWEALKNYGQLEAKDRLVYKWLYMITKNARDYNGTIPEKFDVIQRSHAVFAEYGNVGTEFSYITQEGFGWMNASYQVGLAELPEKLKKSLRELVDYDRL